MLCKESGTALILDDVRCGWRIDDYGSHNYFGFTPDMAIYSKALGNGYAISSCVGTDEYRGGACEVFLTGSSWNDSIAMAAALACLRISEKEKVASSVMKKGRNFASNLRH